MRPSPMVVLEERGQYPLQMTSAEDHGLIQALPPCCADEPLGDGVRARGARTGSRTILTPSVRNTPSNAAVNLESRFSNELRGCRPGAGRPGCGLAAPPIGQSGLLVQPARCTQRLPISMKKKT